jgi:hypothetical protein
VQRAWPYLRDDGVERDTTVATETSAAVADHQVRVDHVSSRPKRVLIVRSTTSVEPGASGIDAIFEEGP